VPFELTIVTPDGERYRGPVDSVVLPGSEGDFGALPNHEHFLAPLRVGEVEIHTRGERFVAAIASGFAAVTGEEVAVMVESCELAHEIDVARAELARDRAEKGLADLTDPDEQRFEQYQEALERAQNRIAVSQKSSSGP
jgi:F-type H+-transporting ATPase subunit epsilon